VPRNTYGLRENLFYVKDREHTVKKRFAIFPSPAGLSLTKLSVAGNNLYKTSLFPPRESLVSDNPARDGKIVTFLTTYYF
jgi:hypothetical protein